VAYYHSYNKRKRENPLPLTSNETIPQQGKERRSHNHSQERIGPMTSSTMISTTTLTMEKKLGCDLKHNLKLFKFPEFENSKENINILTMRGSTPNAKSS